MSIVIQNNNGSFYQDSTPLYFPNEILEMIFNNLEPKERHNFCLLDKRTLDLFHERVYKFDPLSLREAINDALRWEQSSLNSDFFWASFHSGSYSKTANDLEYTLHHLGGHFSEDRFRTRDEIISREAGRCFAALTAQFIAFGIYSAYYDSIGPLLFAAVSAYHFGIVGGLGAAHCLDVSILKLTIGCLFFSAINKMEIIDIFNFDEKRLYNLGTLITNFYIFSAFPFKLKYSERFTKIYRIANETIDFTNIYIKKKQKEMLNKTLY